jgi:hypothetical protein
MRRGSSEIPRDCRRVSRVVLTGELGFEAEFPTLASHCSGVGKLGFLQRFLIKSHWVFCSDFLTNRTDRHYIGVGLTLPTFVTKLLPRIIIEDPLPAAFFFPTPIIRNRTADRSRTSCGAPEEAGISFGPGANRSLAGRTRFPIVVLPAMALGPSSGIGPSER